MQVNKIQNNNTAFGAELKITGYIDDISKKQISAWNKKAQSIGRETDIIELDFGEPININVNKILPKPNNQQYVQTWKRLLLKWFGVSHNDLYISKRDISGSVTLNKNFETKTSEKLDYRYCCDYSIESEANILQKWHSQTTKSCVNKYLNKLKREIRK